MKAYTLVQHIIKNKFPFELDEEIGYGAQGQVFSIRNDSNKVIKLSTLYDVDPILDIDVVYENISKVYRFILETAPPSLVKIHEFGRLDSGSRKTVQGPQSYIIYYSIQEKLHHLSDDEKKVFKTICQAVNDELDFSRNVTQIIKELNGWFSFSPDKVITFYNSIYESPVNHNDFHRRNIMKDKDGNYKLIDFDLAELD